jgi:hypothetical protein
VGKESLPRIGIVHAPFGAATLRDVKRAAAGICHPVLLIRDRVAREQPDVVSLATRLFETVVIADIAESDLAARLDLDGVTTFHDAELDLVDHLLAGTDLPGRTGVSDPWDKLVQRTTLRQHALTRVVAESVESPDDLDAAVGRLGLPLVLKPRRANTSAGLAMLDSSADIDYQVRERVSWQHLLCETRIPDGKHPSGNDWLGDYVSVETINTDQHNHVAVVDKLQPSLAKHEGADGADSLNETGDLIPSRLSGINLAEVLDYTSRCLDALGVTWRVTHAEVKLTPAGPELIEINGRTAGYLSKLLRLAQGPDLIRAALLVAGGRRPPEEPRGPSRHAMLLLPPFGRRSGLVRSHVAAADLLPLPGVASVDEVATYGRPRGANGFRKAVLNLVADSFEDICAHRIASISALGQLFDNDRYDR